MSDDPVVIAYRVGEFIFESTYKKWEPEWMPIEDYIQVRRSQVTHRLDGWKDVKGSG